MVTTLRVFITPREMQKVADEYKQSSKYSIKSAEPLFEEGKDLSYNEWIEKYGNTKMCYRVRLEHPDTCKSLGSTNYFQSWKGVEDALVSRRKRDTVKEEVER